MRDISSTSLSSGASIIWFVIVSVIAVGVILAALVYVRSRYTKAERMVDEWAARSGYRLIERQSRSFFKGPFFWTASRSQIVYRVIVEDQYGVRRSGWVRCGGWWLGLMSGDVDVRWDE